ncbi:AAA family ATPase [Kiritimatiellaeota bacterium B1221]|nr:AAA family ATPase [Kiritimatiellaeota bacterium B1221]
MISPLEMFVEEYLPKVTADAVEEQVERIPVLPVVKRLGDLETPRYGSDPNELIKSRFLYRGGVCLLLGPTGIGKSSFLEQLAVHLSVGSPLFGIVPGEVYQVRGMRILLIQAENDEGDMAEMRDGVLRGCEDLTPSQKTKANENILVATINDQSSDKFAETLELLLQQEAPVDLVMIDPAFAYLGGDSNSQRDVSYFMRELLNPLLQRHKVGLILAHHTNKPMRGKEKDNWEAGDYAYLGAGSAEWVNPARAALALRSLGSDSVFELRAAKRGKRLDWKDAEGELTTRQYIAHHGEPGVICWRQATAEEIEDVTKKPEKGRPRKVDPLEILHCVSTRPGENQGWYTSLGARVMGCSQNTVQNAMIELRGSGLLKESQQSGRSKKYEVSTKGREALERHVSTHDWAGEAGGLA